MNESILTLIIIFGVMIIVLLFLFLNAKYRFTDELKEYFIFSMKSTRKRAVKVWFIQKNRQMQKIIVKYDNDKDTFLHDQGKYIIDADTFVYEGSKPVAYYIEGNPNPMKIDFSAKDMKMDAKTFKQVLDSKFVADLFVGNKEQMLIIICIILSGLGILMQFFIHSGMFDNLGK